MIVAALLLGSARPAPAQDNQPESINAHVNYVYASQFGFGTYEVGGLDVAVYSLPISFTFKDVYRDWDIRLGLPITYGHFRFKNVSNDNGQRVSIKAHSQSLAAEPRLVVDIPVFEHFRFSPLGAWGGGSTLDSGGRVKRGNESIKLNSNENWFYTYQFGYTALYEYVGLPFKLFFGNALIWAGDDFIGTNGDVESYGTLRNGVEGRHPLGFDICGRVPDGGLYFIYDHFFPSLQFTRVRKASLSVSDLFEVGINIGSATALDLPWIGNTLDDVRIGIGYQAGDGLDAVKVTTGFPF